MEFMVSYQVWIRGSCFPASANRCFSEFCDAAKFALENMENWANKNFSIYSVSRSIYGISELKEIYNHNY